MIEDVAPPTVLPPVPFVVGCIRSGTTLLRAMLDSHPDLAIPPESNFIPRLESRFGRGPVDPDEFVDDLMEQDRMPHWHLDETVLRRMLKESPADVGEAVRRVHLCYAHAHGKSRWGHKTPGYVRSIRSINAILPEACFVHLVRDPRDVAPAILSATFGPRTIEGAALHWRDNVSEGIRAGRQLPAGRYTEVAYEQLVESPREVLVGLCERLELDFDESMLHPERKADLMISATRHPGSHTNIRRPISSGVRDWRRTLDDRDAAVIEVLAGPTLRDAGYEPHRPPTSSERVRAAWCRVAVPGRRKLYLAKMKVRLALRRARRRRRARAASPPGAPIRFVHLVPNDLSRGAQVIARVLSAGLTSPQEEHLVVSLFDAPKAFLGPVHALGVHSGRARAVGFDPRAVVVLRRALRKLQPVAVIAHGSESLKYAVAAAGGVPVVYHRIGIANPAAHQSWRKRFYRRLTARAALVVAISHDVEREVVDLLGVRKDGVVMIPNGRDPDSIGVVGERAATTVPQLLFVGHLTRTKRPERFLEVIGALQQRGVTVTGTIVGDGPRLDAVRTAAPSNVDVLGVRHDVPELLRAADVFVFTSIPEGEGMPGVLVEAAMAGLPIVTTRVPGVDDVVVEGMTGLIVAPDDVEAMVDAVERLATSAELRAQMGDAARAHAVEQFSLDDVLVAWRNALGRVVGRSAPGQGA